MLWCLSFAAAALVGTHGIAYWDAGDYARLAVEGRMSGLLLGRPVFLVLSRAILAVGVDVAFAEPVLRWTWTAFSACAAPLFMILALELGLPRAAAGAAGAALACSPAFAHTAHQVLTDAPALSLTIGALALAARPTLPRAWLAGAVLALAIATRETSAWFLISLALLAARAGRRTAIVAVASCLLGTALVVLACHRGVPPSLAGWGKAMHRSSSLRARDVLVALGWAFSAGPAVALAGAAGLRDRELSRALRPVVGPAAVGTALLCFYPFAAWTPRFMLATAPLALLLPAGVWMSRRPRLAAALLLFPLVGTYGATARPRELARRGDDAAARFLATPAPALWVPGHFCPQAELALAIAARKGSPRDVMMLCPGWRWPDAAGRALDRARCEGRTLVLDLRDDAWIGEWEVAPAAAIRAYAAREGLEGPLAIVPPRACP